MSDLQSQINGHTEMFKEIAKFETGSNEAMSNIIKITETNTAILKLQNLRINLLERREKPASISGFQVAAIGLLTGFFGAVITHLIIWIIP